MTVPLSILDLSPISAGSTPAAALRNSVDLARHAEQWGYHRYWVAEHHFVAVASSRPAVLIGQIAAATEHIRVGAAAVQLGYTTAVSVVESFGILDAFYPGRIDLGLGRSGQRRREAERADPASKPPVRQSEWRDVDGVVIPPQFDVSALLASPKLRALSTVLTQPEAVPPDFADQVAEILALLDGKHAVDGFPVRAVPGEAAALTPWIFGSSRGQSAAVAGAQGLPFVASYHSTPATALRPSRPTGPISLHLRSCGSPTSWSPPTSSSPTTRQPPATWPRPSGTGCIRFAHRVVRCPTPTPTTRPR